MASEVGHAKNVAFFEALIAFVASLGSAYAPSNGLISLGKLDNKLTDAAAAMDNVIAMNTLDSTAINARKDLYTKLKPLVTRVLSIYTSSGADQNDIDDVKGFRRKIYGRRATPKPKDDPATPVDESKKTKSSAQTGFTEQVEHLDAIIEIVAGDPKYAPNEVDLQTTALQSYSAQLKTANSACIASDIDAKKARKERNAVMYTPKTGLYYLAGAVKTYINGSFGPKSPEDKYVASLKFKLYDL